MYGREIAHLELLAATLSTVNYHKIANKSMSWLVAHLLDNICGL